MSNESVKLHSLVGATVLRAIPAENKVIFDNGAVLETTTGRLETIPVSQVEELEGIQLGICPELKVVREYNVVNRVPLVGDLVLVPKWAMREDTGRHQQYHTVHKVDVVYVGGDIICDDGLLLFKRDGFAVVEPKDVIIVNTARLWLSNEPVSNHALVLSKKDDGSIDPYVYAVRDVEGDVVNVRYIFPPDHIRALPKEQQEQGFQFLTNQLVTVWPLATDEEPIK